MPGVDVPEGPTVGGFLTFAGFAVLVGLVLWRVAPAMLERGARGLAAGARGGL